MEILTANSNQTDEKSFKLHSAIRPADHMVLGMDFSVLLVFLEL
jgi:hypothetical protein